MAVDSVCTLTPIMRLDRLGHAQPAGDTAPASGFANVLNGILAAAVTDLATGKAQDLHTVSLAVAQADMSFRLILELRNRLADAFQEVTRMQV